MPKVSVTIITLNEAAHIGAAIDGAAWADEVVVVDSGSSDDTVAIARAKGARTSERAWTGYADQKNHATSLAQNDWIFSLDADERIPPTLAVEVQDILAPEPPRRGLTALDGTPRLQCTVYALWHRRNPLHALIAGLFDEVLAPGQSPAEPVN